ncbi:MAG: type II secretion system secretin GspD [Gallionellaceae bacterium]
MVNKKISEKAAALLLATLLAGCATHAPKLTSSNTPPVAPVQPAPPESAAAAGDTSVNLEDSKQHSDKTNDKIQLYPGTGMLVKGTAPGANTAQQANPDDVMLNFDGADLREVVKAIVNDILNENYILDPKVQGTVNLHTSKPIPRSALIPTLETLLRMNGAAIIQEEGVYKIVPAAAAARGSITPQLSGGGSLPAGYSVQIVPLSYVSAKEMMKILEPFLMDASAVHIDELRNLVMLFGTERELKHLMDTISMFDVDWLSGMSVGLFTLQNVDVKTASADLDKIFGDKAQSPLSGLVKLVPIERMNAILVVTSQARYLDQAKTWIERLDRAGTASGGIRLFVYPVQNGQAEKLAALLNEVFGKTAAKTTTPPKLAPGLTPTQLSSTPGMNEKNPSQAGSNTAAQPASSPTPATETVTVGENIKIIADKDNNALLVLASPADYEKIESAIRKLDIPPRQVLIDVTIAEVTLTDETKFGLQWQFTGKSGNGQLNTSGSSTIGALVPGFSYLWTNASVPGGIGAALNVLATDSKVKVISSPHIMVTDNQAASIDVGDQVPTTSQSESVITGGVGVISSIQYVDTGVLLTVTPHINAGGMVTMEIDQEVSAANNTTTSTIDSPTISKRSIKSTVVVKSGETMVLGGLITENKTKSTSGLPFLSRIPILGALFGAQDYVNDRTELIVLITPRVVADSAQAAEVTDEFRKKMGALGEVLEEAGKFKATAQQ